jgi:hypothetical protein
MMMYRINYLNKIKKSNKNYQKNKKSNPNQIPPINKLIKIQSIKATHYQTEPSNKKNSPKIETDKIPHPFPVNPPNSKNQKPIKIQNQL